MNNRTLTLIIALLGLVVLGVIIWVQSQVSWKKTYNSETMQPYGTELYRVLLKDQASEIKTLPKRNKDDSARINMLLEDTATYVFANRVFYSDSSNAEALFSFVERGNTAYIHAEKLSGSFKIYLNAYFHRNLKEYFFIDASAFEEEEEETEDYWDDEYYYENEYYYEDYLDDFDIALPTYLNTQGRFKKGTLWKKTGSSIGDSLIYYNDKGPQQARFQYLSFEDSANALGLFETLYSDSLDLITVLKIKMGKGSLILNVQPLSLTNYHLRNENWFNTHNDLLKYAKSNQVIWDDFSANYYRSAKKVSEETSEEDRKARNEAILSFFLENKSFGWAFLVLVLGVLVYLILGIKRKERIMPVIRKKENQSLAYAENLSLLYLKKKNHFYIARLELDMLFKHLRQAYGIKIDPKEKPSPELASKLAFKADLDLDRCKSFINDLYHMRHYKVWSDEQLTRLNDWSQWWYKNAKH